MIFGSWYVFPYRFCNSDKQRARPIGSSRYHLQTPTAQKDDKMASIPPSSPLPPSPRLLRFRLMSARTGSAEPPADDSSLRANFNGSRFPDNTNIRQSGVGTPVEHGHDIVHRMTPVQNESPLHRAG